MFFWAIAIVCIIVLIKQLWGIALLSIGIMWDDEAQTWIFNPWGIVLIWGLVGFVAFL